MLRSKMTPKAAPASAGGDPQGAQGSPMHGTLSHCSNGALQGSRLRPTVAISTVRLSPRGCARLSRRMASGKGDSRRECYSISSPAGSAYASM